MSNMDVLVGEVQNLTDTTTELVTATSISGGELDRAKKATADAATVSTQKASATSATRAKVESLRNAANADRDAAIKTVYSDKASFDSKSGKVPVADGTGKIHKGTLPTHPEISMPEPDFWMPLIDSVEIKNGFGHKRKTTIAGKEYDFGGRFAKFFRPTEATYIDKKGVMRVAKINEPRFEKAGLLIEGTSTNLLYWSEEEQCFVKQTSWKVSRAGSWGDVRVFRATGAIGDTYALYSYKSGGVYGQNGDLLTFSLFIRKGGKGKLGIFIRGTDSERVNVDLSNFNVYEASEKAQIDDYGDFCRVSVSARVIDDKAIGPAIINANADNEAIEFFYACPQFEKLSFATSYIPSKGTVQNRGRDVLNTDGSHILQFPATIAYSLENYRVSSTYGTVINVGNRGTGVSYFLQTKDTRKGTAHFHIGGQNRGNRGRGIGVEPLDMAISVGADSWKYLLDGEFQFSESLTMPGIPAPVIGFGDNAAFFHLKNFRFWQTELSENQMASLGQ